jgi:hypothetical protein
LNDANTIDLQVFDNCILRYAGSGSSGRIPGVGSSSVSTGARAVILKNCALKYGGVGQAAYAWDASLLLEGCSIESGSSTPTTAWFSTASSGRSGKVLVSGCDLTNFASTLVFSSGGANTDITIRDCKLPGSWEGSLAGSAITTPYEQSQMHNCDSADTNYRIWTESYTGSVKSETTIKRTGGASDGTTGLSWKMVSLSGAGYPISVLKSPEIVQWCDSTGSKTATIEIVTDNVTLTDAECWIEVMYLGTSGYPLGSWISDAKAGVLATAANQTTSSETWTTTGLATPVKQKLAVTFTVNEKGYIHARVVLAKATTTVYVDPLITIS